MSALRPLVLEGDCLARLKDIPDDSVAAVVTDPPYGLSNTDPAHVVEALTHWANGDRAFIPSGRGFMGKEWDAFVPPPAVWDECIRILKPGGHLLAFAGSRTFDLMTLSIRFAGFDIRDSIAWLYGSGFPKSMDVAKAIDATVLHGGSNSKRLREAELAGDGETYTTTGKNNGIMGETVTVERKAWHPETDQAKTWDGWGTALKPAFEPIVVARKPLIGTVAANVLKHGTGALNIDATRVGDRGEPQVQGARRGMVTAFGGSREGGKVYEGGRWPANVILDEDQAAALDEQSGYMKDGTAVQRNGGGQAIFGGISGNQNGVGGRKDQGYGGGGSASRFFYVAKAPKSERPVVDGTAHPTVKPLALMRWLIRLVTPPGECIVDPFAGSGTTLEAAYLEDVEAIGVEVTPDYLPLIAARLDRVEQS